MLCLLCVSPEVVAGKGDGPAARLRSAAWYAVVTIGKGRPDQTRITDGLACAVW